MPQYLNT